MTAHVVNADIMEWARTYDGLKFHAILDRDGSCVNVIFPKDGQGVSIPRGAFSLPRVVGDVPGLDRSQLGMVIETRVGVPESPVSLDKHIPFGQVEVKKESSDSELQFVSNLALVKNRGNGLFEAVVRLAGSAFADLFARQDGVALTRGGVRKLARVRSGDLSSCLWRVGAAEHAVALAAVGLPPGRNSKELHFRLDGTLCNSESLAYLGLGQPRIVQALKRFCIEGFCPTVDSLGLRVRSLGYTVSNKPVVYGPCANAIPSSNLRRCDALRYIQPFNVFPWRSFHIAKYSAERTRWQSWA